jgi:hypothetical protein
MGTRQFTRITRAELAEIPAVIAAARAMNGDPRLEPLYNQGGFALLVLIRLLCWHVLLGPWANHGNGNRLVRNGRELWVGATGTPWPMNVGVSVMPVWWQNGSSEHFFFEVVTSEDELPDAALHAWIVSAIRRAKPFLDAQEPAPCP